MNNGLIKQAPKVKAVFAYYNELDGDSWPNYFILESNVSSLPQYGNVSGDQLMKEEINLPVTPTYESWVRMGRPVYRGEKKICRGTNDPNFTTK